MNEEIAKQLSTLIKTFNDKRVITAGETQEVLKAIVTILSENKKGVESLNAETKESLESTLQYIEGEHAELIRQINSDLSKTRSEIEKATKEQNDRAFKRLQTLISQIRMPQDGKDGADGQQGPAGKDGEPGSPDTAEQVRDKLETLEGDERLDAKHIKGWEKFLGTIKKNGKEMLVGGIRFLENLADVSVPTADKRQDLLIQYDTTDNRWEGGVALTVSTTQPTNPKINDLWVDIS